MSKYTNDYVYGSEVPKVEYDVYEENKILKKKKASRNAARLKLKITGIFLFSSILLFAIIYRYSLITETNYNIDKLEKQYQTLLDEAAQTKVEIGKNTDLEHIRKVAVDELKMQEPMNNQKVEIKVPKKDFTRVNNDVNETEKSSGFSISSFFNMLIGNLSK